MAVWIKGTLEMPGPPGSQQPWAQKIWCYLSSSLSGWCSESHPGWSFSCSAHEVLKGSCGWGLSYLAHQALKRPPSLGSFSTCLLPV